jgi:hypothetical protein
MEKEEKARKGDRRGRQGSGVEGTGVVDGPANPAEGRPAKGCGKPARERSWSLRSLPSLANSSHRRPLQATAGPLATTPQLAADPWMCMPGGVARPSRRLQMEQKNPSRPPEFCQGADGASEVANDEYGHR